MYVYVHAYWEINIYATLTIVFLAHVVKVKVKWVCDVACLSLSVVKVIRSDTLDQWSLHLLIPTNDDNLFKGSEYYFQYGCHSNLIENLIETYSG